MILTGVVLVVVIARYVMLIHAYLYFETTIITQFCSTTVSRLVISWHIQLVILIFRHSTISVFVVSYKRR